ncbi:MAG: thiosulfate reductase [Chlorobi bacterium]|nr:thiosulfate reductase [Chlorobiota bacterium]
MKKLEKKHPLAIRWFHWINFPVLAIMIWSGTLIYWANDVYRIGFGDTTLLKFYPDSFYELFSLGHRLAEGMAWHFVFMWVLVINGVLYVLYTIFSGEWRYLVPNRRSFREAIQVVLHDLHLSRTPPPSPRRYNGAQQIAYTAVVLMGMGSVLTGLAVYKPTQLAWLASMLGGYGAARAEHFILTVGYVLFFIVHIAQVIRAGWGNFRGMVAGYDLVDVPNVAEPENAGRVEG